MINEGLDYALKRKKWILLLGALGFSAYGAYRLCKLPSVVKNRDRAMKTLSALASITEFFGDSAETLGVISRDLKDFIQSDSDQIPGSLKQVFKITKSNEFSDSIVRVSWALTMGISRGYQIEAPNTHPGPSFSDRALDKLFSPAGYGFASVIVGSFSRNMVMAIYADREVTPGSGNPGQKWVDVITDDKFRNLIGDCVQQFVTTMVTVYLDKTMDINTYDEILSSLTNPEHEEQVRNLMVLICNGAVETFVRTSHQVLTNSKSNSDSDSSSASSYLIRKGSSTISKVFNGQELVLSKLKPRNIFGNMGFVLELTRRVTLATVKSFMGFLFEGVKTRFLEAYSYLNAKSLVIMTVWISLYLHMLSGPWSLMSV
ncbi:hypothetical protein L1987_36769 [Smallanthus sonchifolius]|uniref:Uncharacterized protein n=1 Tax=Smallanthus sonchifolius TaxID=185202 RepID=A0ACB9HH02_9ASTR|nr:hypothetical protein L1987_36769 [Smallanthus sonchifolius]